ncbi:hypothetical protein BDD12DRAFT_830375 [Trichophaea hybrida]|nr:hypothetical protein BDD12DRAFT_830375 [Trichophaea hybrida]
MEKWRREINHIYMYSRSQPFPRLVNTTMSSQPDFKYEKPTPAAVARTSPPPEEIESHYDPTLLPTSTPGQAQMKPRAHNSDTLILLHEAYIEARELFARKIRMGDREY